MTDDEVDDYVRHLQGHLPPGHADLSVEQVRAVLDAEAAYFEHRFGNIHGWRALLRAFFGRGDPPADKIEAALPEFEAYAVQALSGRRDLSREDIRAVMRVEGEAGPLWIPPQRDEEGGTAEEEGDR